MAFRAIIERADQEENGVAVTIVLTDDVSRKIEKTLHITGNASAMDEAIIRELNNLNTPILSAKNVVVGNYTPPVPPDPTPEQIAKDKFEADLTLYLRMKKADDLGLKVDLNALQKQLDIVNGEFLPDYFDLFGTGQEPV